MLRAGSSYVCPVVSKLCVVSEIHVIRVSLCACQCAENTKFLVRASYLEIYNEEIRDLLGIDTKQRLEVSCCFSKQNRRHTVQHEQPKDLSCLNAITVRPVSQPIACSEHVLCTTLYKSPWQLQRKLHNSLKVKVSEQGDLFGRVFFLCVCVADECSAERASRARCVCEGPVHAHGALCERV